MITNTIGILLAAGMGLRLKDLTGSKPKALIKIDGRPLIYYAISFLKKIGIKKIIVIGGFKFNNLKREVAKIDSNIAIVENRQYAKGNLYSLVRALPFIKKSFILMNNDHIYRKSIASCVKNQLKEGIIAFTDNDRQLGDDDMKVLTDRRGNIKKISKKLQKYDRGYVGMTFCHKKMLAHYKKGIEKTKTVYGKNAVVEDVLQVLAQNRVPVTVGDISGYGWYEIDYPHELAAAKKGIIQNKDLYI